MDSIWIATDNAHARNGDVHAYLLDIMAGYDRRVYRDDAARLGLDAVASEEWAQAWAHPSAGDNVHATRAAADAYLRDIGAPWRHVLIEVTPGDVRAALSALIADGDA